MVGVLLSLLGLGLTLGGGALLTADAAQRDGRYLTVAPQRIQSTGYALTTPSAVIDPGQLGLSAAAPITDLASVQVRVTPVVPGQEVFVGLAETAEAAAYLDGVPHTDLGDVAWQQSGPQPGRRSLTAETDEDLPQTPSDRVPEAPADQDFWATSASGTGTQELTVEVQPGQWTLVVMNADASRPVWVEVQPGVHTQVLGPVGTGLLIGGLVSLVLGIPLLLLGTAGLGRDIDPAARRGQAGGDRTGPRPGPGAAAATVAGPGRAPSGIYPVGLTGYLDRRLSRGLWLVKWLLAIPHLLILGILTGSAGVLGSRWAQGDGDQTGWATGTGWSISALGLLVLVAAVVLLFTARYPHGIFHLVVGLTRWVYRVFAYVLLLRDEYPPFRLDQGPTDPPAQAATPSPEPHPAAGPTSPPQAPAPGHHPPLR